MAVTFRVVFEGKIAGGQDINAVQGRLLQIFKGNQEAVKRFFTGNPVIVKEQLDWETANKYKAVFAKAGVPLSILPTAEASLSLTMEEPRDPEVATPVAETLGPDATRTRPVPPPVELSPSPALNMAAAVVILLIFASLGLRFWASHKLDKFVSLDHVAVNGERVVLHGGGKLFLASRTGQLERVLDLADLGVAGPVADLELLNDGSLLLGDMEMKKILRCDPATKSCLPFAPTGEFTLAENFKFLADQERQLLYIADTNNDRLLVQNLSDSSCALADSSSRLSYPNDLAKDGDRLYLCDTNQFRIIPFRVEKDKVAEIEGTLNTMPGGLPVTPEEIAALAQDPDKLKAKLAGIKDNLGQIAEEGGHAKPFALAMGEDGNLWAAQLNTVMTNGAIRIITPQGQPVGAVKLEPGAVPVDLVRFNQGMLAVDSGLIRAYTIDPATHMASDYGDQAFRAEMEKIGARRGWLEKFKKLGLSGAIFFGLLALGVGVIAKKKGMA